ncbi:MAG: S9 family peptidase [Myxococcales bacterium]|nr:S9 family peptidase [Myxococcales bacterium]
MLAGALGACQVAPPEVNALTLEDLTRVRSVGTARVSPDGRYIAYVLYRAPQPFRDADGGHFAELHVVDQSGRSRPYVTGDVHVHHVAWTPDGKGIAYLAKRGDDKHSALYVIPIDGGESRRVLTHETSIRAFAFSGDGKEVAFIASGKRSKEVKKLRKKGFKAQVYEEGLREVKLFIGKPDPESRKHSAREITLPGVPSALGFSPSGRKLVVALAPTPLIDDHYMQRRLHVIDADTGKVLGKLDNPGKLGHSRISPDGEHLAVISAADLNDPQAGRLMVGKLSGGKLRDLLPGFAGHVHALAWRDKRTLVYVAYKGVQTVVGQIAVDGSGNKTLIGSGAQVMRSVSLSRDGKRAALVADSPAHPREVFSVDVSAGAAQPKRLTNSNPWLAKEKLAKQEAVTYKARDGLEIGGVLVYPLATPIDARGRAKPVPKAVAKAPLIVSVHGGPESHVANGWVTSYGRPGQVAAARGYAVLYPNYRGSTGRGVAYSKKDQADYAGKEFDDVVDGVKHLVAKGLVDVKRVGITGGSYGGFAAAWGATKLSEHFAASVMFVGISDHISKAGTTDIPNEMHLVHARRWPWDHWDWFRERSPIYHVKKARTPILIVAGKDDTRVHPSQSMELFRYLKLLKKVPVRLVLYPGEGHGNRRAAARYDYSLRLMRWMDHYLAPGAKRDAKPPPHELDYPLRAQIDKAKLRDKAKAAKVEVEPAKASKASKTAKPKAAKPARAAKKKQPAGK